MKPQAREKALAIANKVGHVLLATADRNGVPHLAAARKISQADEDHLAVSEWFCPGTIANLDDGGSVSLVAYDADHDDGVQIIGQVERVRDKAVMDGYDPQMQSSDPMPQVQRELLVRVDKVLHFTAAPHSDLEE